ncbi:MAG TPA: hypothetical protein VK513_04515, partial [Terriglobales bacterium]|nr:hypothetical protein [Terriglobales bacterium]
VVTANLLTSLQEFRMRVAQCSEEQWYVTVYLQATSCRCGSMSQRIPPVEVSKLTKYKNVF